MSKMKWFKQEQNEKARVEKRVTELKELFNSDEEVNLSFKRICEIGNSYLVYNLFTKIVYIKQAYTRGYDTFATEHFCPFISSNGRYYKYIESENKIVEV